MIFWQNLLDKLQDKQKVYVLTVIENSGSTPGRKGFKMMVAQDGFLLGSIGGGVMEFSLVTMAKDFLQEENPPTFFKRQTHRRDSEDSSGMICSGKQTVAFHCLSFKDISVITSIISCLKNGKKGTLKLTDKVIEFSDKPAKNRFECQINSDQDWFYEELIGFKETLYIIGGGHVGVPVSELFVNLGFYVVVFDNREDLNTLENNSFAHQKLVINYNDISDYIPQEDSSYVAIMTNKCTDDMLVLSKLIRNKYKFLGVLGSKAKIHLMWNFLMGEGFTKEELNSVYAPIGLPIKSETTEEIAVSIAAQIIQIKNSKKRVLK